jgi:hypothetical protein
LSGKSRLIIAFRHSYGLEPQVLMYYIMKMLAPAARKVGVHFSRPPHTIFVYGYEVPRWSGGIVRWVLPRVGALSIHHAKMDREGMERIISAIMAGPYPVALAPEGQVSYSSDAVPRLEPGTVRIGFMAADRLARGPAVGQSAVPVEILPLSVHCRYGKGGEKAMRRLLARVERICGIPVGNSDGGVVNAPSALRMRMTAVREAILAANECRYGLAGEALPPPRKGAGDDASGHPAAEGIADEDARFRERLSAVINAALLAAERIMGGPAQAAPADDDELFARMYTLRQTYWDSLIIPELKSFEGVSPLEAALKDLRVGEAWHAERHLEIVDFSWYFRIPVPSDDAPLHQKIEYIQNLWDFANRTMGGAFSNRVNIWPKREILQPGRVISLTDRLPDYHQNKRAAIDGTMKDLNEAFLQCVKDVNNGDGR